MNFDTVVVGGGIIGCTLGYFLGKRGQKVAVVERGPLAGGTSARNFSWVNATSKTANANYHHLNALGVAGYDDLVEALGATALGVRETGSLGVTRAGDKAATAVLHQQATALERLGYACRWIDRAELGALEPGLTFAEDAQALLAPRDKVLNAPVFTRAMAAEIRRLDGKVFENCAALGLDADDNGVVKGIETALGPMGAGNVVVAAGPDTPEVLSDLTGYDAFATRFPVGKVPGLLVTTPPVPEGMLHHLVYTDCGGEFHFFPDFNGGLRLGSDVADGVVAEDGSPDTLRAQARMMLQRMQDIAPWFGGAELLDACRLDIGIRAYPEDGLSIIDALPGAEGLFVVATHSGVTLAPAIGALMAEFITTQARPAALAPFTLARFPGFG